MEAPDLATCMSTNNDSFIRSSTNQPVYYGVNILDAGYSTGGSPLVFTERIEALQVMKKHKGARFKGFPSRNEAATFSTQLQTSTPDKSQAENNDNAFETFLSAEKNNSFKSLKSQETVKFRKLIEAGNLEGFKELAWSNPRYLISSGDTPTVLQEGFHYNALHVAAKSKQGDLLKVILSTIQDDKFLKLLFNEDSNEIFNQRKKFIIDLYLNLPDKGMCETPLHFACKFGCLKAVEVLLSHPSCDRNRKNKYEKTAREIICDRAGDANLKKLIDNLFEAQYYIPVLRSEGNSIQPIIGKPFAINDPTTVIKNQDLPGPVNALLVIKAKAGPMPLKKVNLFYKKWKLPMHIGSPAKQTFSTKANLDNSIKLSDSDKGLERVGRQLAREFQVGWTEYWSFMNSWCDISTNEGLNKLENYLRELRKIKTAEIEACNNMSIVSESYSNSSLNQSLSPMSVICQKLEKFHLHSTPRTNESELDSARLKTSRISATSRNVSAKSEQKNRIGGNLSDIVTKLNFDMEPKTGLKRKNIDDESSIAPDFNSLHYIVIQSHIIDNLSNFFVDLIREEDYVLPSFENLIQLTKSSLEYLTNSTSNQNDPKYANLHKFVASNLIKSLREILSNHDLNCVSNACELILEQDSDSSSEGFCVESEIPSQTFLRRSIVPIKKEQTYFKENLQCVLKYLVKLIGKFRSFDDHRCQCFGNVESNIDNLSFELGTSLRSDSEDDEEYVTPPSSRSSSPMETPGDIIEIFIQGLEPSKADLDVLHALDGVEIDENQFPSVKLWMHCLDCYPKEVHKIWESPALTKMRKNGPPASAPSRFSTQINESAAKSLLSRFKVQKGAYSSPIQRKTFNLEDLDSPRDFNDSFSNISF